MVTGYITRGTTIRGKTVDEGTVHDMDELTFGLLKLSGCVREHVPAEPVAVVETETEKTSKKKVKAHAIS
jgi:hypothetical protein